MNSAPALGLFIAAAFAAAAFLFCADGARAAEWVEGWQYRQKITVDSAKVSGSSAHTDFPMLVSFTDGRLKSSENGGNVARSNGGDIMFAAADGTTKLDHEIEKYDPASGELVSWVRIPSLSPSVNTEIYLYYGNPKALNQWNPAGVWSEEYKGVWHLKEEGEGIGGTFYEDSTANGHYGEDMVSAEEKEGKVGLGQEFDGAGPERDDYINLRNRGDWNLSQRDFTIELWFRDTGAEVITNGTVGHYINVFWRSTGGYPGAGYSTYVNATGSGFLGFGFRADEQVGTYPDGTPRFNHLDLYDWRNFRDNKWHQMVVTVNQDQKRGQLYVDGVRRATDTWRGNLINYDVPLTLGGVQGSSAFPGFMDEFRVSHATRSREWIATQYANQNSPGTFYRFSAEEDNGPPGEDTAPPLRANGQPKEFVALSEGLREIDLSLETNENAVCRYATDPDTSYDLMANDFETTGGEFHSSVLEIPSSGKYYYYVRCRDEAGNTNSDDYPIIFEARITSGGGLWGHYSVGRVYKKSFIENINFPLSGANNFNDVLLERLGTRDDVTVRWAGAIYASKGGTYLFDIDVYNELSRFHIDNVSIWQGYGDMAKNVYLSAGWHILYLTYYNSGTAKAQLYWTPPGGEREIIPAAYLDPRHWAEKIIAIPDKSKPKAKVNYFAAGVGAQKVATDPVIEVEFPDGVTLDDIMENEIWTFWLNYDNSTGKIKNDFTGQSQTVEMEHLTTRHGIRLGEYRGAMAKIPAEIVSDNGTGKFKFSFSAKGARGVGLVVPYEDETVPEGRVSIVVSSADGNEAATPLHMFPIKENITERGDLKPFFMFMDGETKRTINPSTEECQAYPPCPRVRPNYAVWLSGTGDPPDEFRILKNEPGFDSNKHLISPALRPITLPVDFDDPNSWYWKPDYWYPSFGREGPQFDIISQNYRKNLWILGEYVTNPDGGHLNDVTPEEGDTWLAFQYYGSNFDPDIFGSYAGEATGSGESGPMVSGGIFSTFDIGAPSDPALSAGPGACETVDLSWTDNSPELTETFELEWSPDQINYFSLGEFPKSQLSFSHQGLAGGETYYYRLRACGADPEYFCSGWSEASAVPFVCEPLPDVGICGSLLGRSSCLEPEEDSLCDAGEAELSDPFYNSSKNQWEWKCVGNVSTDTCTLRKYCPWKEVAP